MAWLSMTSLWHIFLTPVHECTSNTMLSVCWQATTYIVAAIVQVAHDAIEDAAFKCSILHRDLSPSNFAYTSESKGVLFDFSAGKVGPYVTSGAAVDLIWCNKCVRA